MSDFDTLIHGHAVTPYGQTQVSIGILEGQIAAIGSKVKGKAKHTITVKDGLILPGFIDAHVHFNEPGRTDWEGFETGSTAIAAGGATTFFDMPLNSSPPVLDRASFEEKRRLGEQKSRVDFALWGGLTPDSLDHLEALAEAGAIGFKAFMCPSGLDEFGAADASILKRGMRIAAKVGLPVAVHAEDPAVIAKHQAAHPCPSPGSMADWLDSRPIAAELSAIRIAIELAAETGCKLHIVHVTCAEGIDLVTQAKRSGVDVTVETCPHYLLMDRAAAIAIGPRAKCAPPIREVARVEALWDRMETGAIDTLGSDHSPSPLDMKQGEDVFAMWGGIAGCQHGLPLLLDGKFGALDPFMLATLASANVAARFGLAGTKGCLAVGMDADFSILRSRPHVIEQGDLLDRHKLSPYVGMNLRWQVESTWLRGRIVTAETRGQFISPAKD
jgi:allantoinase